MPRKIPQRRTKKGIRRKQVVNFGKGLNNLGSDSLIDDQELSAVNNMEFVETGAVRKRGGYTQVGDDLSNNPKGLGMYSTESVKRVVTVDGGTVKYNNSGTWTSISGDTLDSSAEINMNMAEGNLFIWDGVSGGCYYDGSTITRGTAIPKCKFGIYYKDNHWAAGAAGQPNRLYRAKSGDVTDFTDSGDDSTSHPGATTFAGTNEANFYDIDLNDGDEITALAIFQDILLVFKRRAIYQVTVDSSGSVLVAPITKSSGCVSHKSVANVGNDVFYHSPEGTFVIGNEPNFQSAIRTNELSARISPEFDSIDDSSTDKINATYFDNKYFLAVPQGGTDITTTLPYDRRFLGWTKWTSFTPNTMLVFTDTDNSRKLYFADDTDTKVWEWTPDTFNDNAASITSSVTTKSFDLGTFSEKKRFAYIDLLFRQISGSININIYTDGGNLTKSTAITNDSQGGMGAFMLGEEVLGNDDVDTTDTTTQTSNVPYRVKINKTARTIKVELTNSNTDEYFVFLGLRIGYYSRSPFLFDSSRKLQ